MRERQGTRRRSDFWWTVASWVWVTSGVLFLLGALVRLWSVIAP